LVARHIEANGIPTVIIGSALDVVEHCGVPRFLFTDFPLGNPCGHPWRRDMQKAVFRQALELLETARVPRTTVKTAYGWKESDPDWRSAALTRPTGSGSLRLGKNGAGNGQHAPQSAAGRPDA
jgi:hypothetical protein